MVAERPLVFVTVGTDHHPFDRLMQWIDDWIGASSAGARVFVQCGTSKPPERAESAELITHGELHTFLSTAAAVVCHGGPASITECRDAGVVPIVVPREHRFGEHVDDHQVRFGRRMADLTKVHLAGSSEHLSALLDAALSGSDGFRFAPGEDAVDGTIAAFERLLGEMLTGARRHRSRSTISAGR